MDEFLGFPRRERVKPCRTASEYKGHFWLLFVPAKSNWCAYTRAKEIAARLAHQTKQPNQTNPKAFASF